VQRPVSFHAFQQIIEREAENVVSGRIMSVAVQNSESVSVSVGRKPRQSFFSSKFL